LLENEAGIPLFNRKTPSSSVQLSEYVISRLEAALVSGTKLVVVDRANLDKVREEQGFRLSGEVDDNSAKSMDERWWIDWGDHGLIKEYMNKVLLQDLDNPSKSYKAMDVGKAEDGGRYYSFQNVQGTKFKLTDGNNPPISLRRYFWKIRIDKNR
jgi:hypothetical protein